MPNPQRFPIPDLSLGLKTTDRPSRIPVGACQAGSKNFDLYRGVLRSARGFKKKTKRLVDDYTYRLDGRTQYFRGFITGTGSPAAAATAACSIQIAFRLDTLPTQFSSAVVGAEDQYRAVLLYRGTGYATGGSPSIANTRYEISIGPDTSAVPPDMRPHVVFRASDGAGLLNWIHSTPLELGKTYFASMTFGAVNGWRLYVGEAGAAQTQDNPVSAIAIADLSGADVFLGAVPASDAVIPEKYVQYLTRGVLQEFRIWDKELTSTEVGTYTAASQLTDLQVQSLTNLTYYQRLTGSGTDDYFFAPQKGSGPTLRLYPRDVTWRDSGHTLGSPLAGTASLDFDGVYQGLLLPRAVEYRRFQPNEEGGYPWATYFAASFRLKPRTVSSRQTIAHFVHCPTTSAFTSHDLASTTATGTFVPASGVTGNLLIETLDVGAGVIQFRAVAFHQQTIKNEDMTASIVGGNVAHNLASTGIDPYSFRAEITLTGGGKVVVVDDGAGAIVKKHGSGTINPSTIDYATGAVAIDFTVAITAATATRYRTRNATSIVSTVAGGLVAGTEYTVTVATNFAAAVGVLSISVNALAVVTGNCTSGGVIPWTLDAPEGSGIKYAACIGRAIKRTRKSLSQPTNPDDVEIEYNYARCFDGEIKQIAIAKSEVAFDARQLHGVMRNQLIDRSDITSYGVPFTTFYTLEEGKGKVIEDVGGIGNSLSVQIDPDHVWGKSGITTVTRRGIKSAFDHRYRTPTGEARKRIGVAAGSVYDIDPSTGALTWLADGFRNDDNNRVSTMRFPDSTYMVATGSNPPFNLWKDQLYRASIAAPSGIIAWGLANQGDHHAGQRRGEPRKYAFTFYSRHQGKRSSVRFGPEVHIRFQRANTVFGDDAEINQTHPSFGPSVKRAPFNVSKSTTASPYVKVQFAAWSGRDTTLSAGDPEWYETNPSTSGANTNATALKRVNLSKVPKIGDKGGAEIDEVIQAVDLANNRVFVEDYGDERIEFKGAFVGTQGFLWLQDSDSSIPTVRDTATAIMQFTGVDSSGTSTAGTGVTGHGLGMPFSSDPQVTDLEIWRTVSGGNEYKLVARIPNGTRSYTDRTDDADLVGETLDINRGDAPGATDIFEFEGRAVTFGDPLAPQRLSISAPLEPWNFPPASSIDLADNDVGSMAIKGAAHTESTLILFGTDVIMAIRATGNPTLPFQKDLRAHQVGSVAKNGVVDVLGIFYFVDERGFHAYDTSTLRSISDDIDDTFAEIPPEHYDKIVAIHDREHSAIMWFYASGDSEVDGEVVNDSALVYWYETGAWSKLEGIYVADRSLMPDANEVNRIWLIDPIGYISQFDEGSNYGVDTLCATGPFTITNVVNDSTIEIQQCSNLTNLPEGYKGLQIVVVKADGTRHTRLVLSDDIAATSTITLDRDVVGVAADTDVVYVASIESDWISGEFMPAGQEAESEGVDAHFQLTPQSTSASFSFLWLWKYGYDSTGAIEGSQTISNQRNEIKVPISATASSSDFTPGATQGRRVRLRFKALGPDKPWEVRSAVLLFNTDTGPAQERDDE